MKDFAKRSGLGLCNWQRIRSSSGRITLAASLALQREEDFPVGAGQG